MLKVKQDYLYWLKRGLHEGIIDGMLADNTFPRTRSVEHLGDSVFLKVHADETRAKPKKFFVYGYVMGYNHCTELIAPSRSSSLEQYLLKNNFIKII